jgi:UDP-glucose 4-epimerase
MRAVVLGGNGFIGSHLVDELRKAKWQVTVYDRAEERYRARHPDVDYVLGEFGNRLLLDSVLSRVDAVFHLISTTIPQTSNEAPIFDIRTNLIDTISLLDLCIKNRVSKVIFISSGGTVYGIPSHLPISESHPTNPICSYGIIKLAIEKYLHFFHHIYNLNYIVLRPSNPYGERQNPFGAQGVVSVFLGCIARKLPIIIWGDGSVVRDYLHVSDLARACVLAAVNEGEFQTFNIGSGKGCSLNDLVEILRGIVGNSFEVIHTPKRRFDVPELVLDVRLAKRELGWAPLVSLDVGLERTWQWTQTLNLE